MNVIDIMRKAVNFLLESIPTHKPTSSVQNLIGTDSKANAQLNPVLIDGDQCFVGEWMFNLFPHATWIQASQPSRSTRKTFGSRPGQLIMLQGYKPGKEATDKYIASLATKLILDGHKVLTIVSNDQDMVDIIRTIDSITKQNITVRLITVGSLHQKVKDYFRASTRKRYHAITVNHHHIKMPCQTKSN